MDPQHPERVPVVLVVDGEGNKRRIRPDEIAGRKNGQVALGAAQAASPPTEKPINTNHHHQHQKSGNRTATPTLVTVAPAASSSSTSSASTPVAPSLAVHDMTALHYH